MHRRRLVFVRQTEYARLSNTPANRPRCCYPQYLNTTVTDMGWRSVVFPACGAVLVLTCTVMCEDLQCMRCDCDDQSQCESGHCCFHFDSYPLRPLHVHVDCSQPANATITDLQHDRRSDSGEATCRGERLQHKYSCLTAMPHNYCHYNRTRAVILSDNSLTEFPGLGCLPNLGLLDLRHNMLSVVPADAFLGLAWLRDVYLDHNAITYIHPRAFQVHLTELNIFSVSYNRLLVAEMWPMALHYPFCLFDFSHNDISNFSNQQHWTLNLSFAAQYGPGFVDLSYNKFVEAPLTELGQYGIRNLLDMAKFMKWGFDFRYNPFNCDCKMYQIVFWARELISVIWRSYFNVTCATPPKLHGVPVYLVPLDDLTCTVTKDCPAGCVCRERPAQRDVHVDCSNGALTELPLVMPGGKLSIQLTGNTLHCLSARQYWLRATHVNLTHTGLRTIEDGAARLLKDVQSLDLSENELHALPHTLQALSPDAVVLDPLTLTCTCELEWFPAWIQHATRPHHAVFCATPDGRHLPLANTTHQDLGCHYTPDRPHYNLPLLIVAAVLMVAVPLLAVFRYEVQVLTQHVLVPRRPHKAQCQSLLRPSRYDVFVSAAADSEVDVAWVQGVLMPALDRRSLTVYWPQRDCVPGCVAMDEAVKRLQESVSALVVVSPAYLTSPACLFHFRQAYSYMIARKHGRLVLLLLGDVTRRAMQEQRMRAMFRLGLYHSALRTDRLNAALYTLSTGTEHLPLLTL